MLRHRVIPMVLLDGYSVVKTIKFDVRRNLGNPITVARIYNTRDVDELILLDIDAAKEQRRIDLVTVEDITRECFMPLTVGGGLRTCEDIAEALAHGADKVAINTIFLEDPSVARESARVFGSQCIVVSLDVTCDSDGRYILHSHSGGRVRRSFDEAIALCNECEVGEILVNSVDRDGVMTGYDIALIDYAARRTSIPIIAAGGAGKPEDCAMIVKAGASAAAAASMFHFTSITPRTCRDAMRDAGIPVR